MRADLDGHQRKREAIANHLCKFWVGSTWSYDLPRVHIPGYGWVEIQGSAGTPGLQQVRWERDPSAEIGKELEDTVWRVLHKFTPKGNRDDSEDYYVDNAKAK